ncbi:MAG: hypothetical protein IPI57_16620 [Candidatus Competibacteraceae bacterium]|nr:hypothetical protein [Candidatus Competibacteraceae bacterium]
MPDLWPSLVTATSQMPRSTPTVRPVGASGLMNSSHMNATKYRPLASLLTVAIFGVPSGIRDQRTLSAPSLGSLSSEPAA